MERSQLKILSQRIEDEPRRFIQVIYGPRQVGKTTMILQYLDRTKLPYHYASADAVSSEHALWIRQQWQIAELKTTQPAIASVILALDEIQKINNWSEQIKQLWDTDTQNRGSVKLVLLGSSRLMLQQGLTESLAGRFETIYMPHWSYVEMQTVFGLNLDEYIWFGGYPGSAMLRTDEQRWKEYLRASLIETSLSRDIMMLTRIDKPALMKQLFEVGCAYSGQILSLNKILGQLQDAGNTTTLAHYLTLLDQAGLLTGLQKYSPHVVRQRASIPKFQVHNMALKSSLELHSFREIRNVPAKWGRWVESAIGAHLVNQCLKHGFSLYYWRHRNDEVDFVFSGKDNVIAIEAKTGTHLKISGMSTFQREFNPDRTLVIGYQGMPVEEFLGLEIIDLV